MAALALVGCAAAVRSTTPGLATRPVGAPSGLSQVPSEMLARCDAPDVGLVNGTVAETGAALEVSQAQVVSETLVAAAMAPASVVAPASPAGRNARRGHRPHDPPRPPVETQVIEPPAEASPADDEPPAEVVDPMDAARAAQAANPAPVPGGTDPRAVAERALISQAWRALAAQASVGREPGGVSAESVGRQPGDVPAESVGRQPGDVSSESLGRQPEGASAGSVGRQPGDVSTNTALSALARHRQEFPDGVYAAERDALEVSVLFAAGRKDEAAAAAERFLRRYPECPFAATVRAALPFHKSE